MFKKIIYIYILFWKRHVEFLNKTQVTTDEVHKELSIRDQVKKNDETLRDIMNKERSTFNSNFWTMLIYKFR